MDRDKSIIGQNAGTTAAAILNTLVNAGIVHVADVDDALATFDRIRKDVFAGSLELAGAETVVAGFSGGAAPSSVSSVTSSYSEPTPAAGRPGGDVEIKFGKYAGKTIADVYASGKDGAEYLEWAAGNLNNDFLKKHIRSFLAAA